MLTHWSYVFFALTHQIPTGDRPSAGTVLTTKMDMIYHDFLLLFKSWCWIHFGWSGDTILNWQMNFWNIVALWVLIISLSGILCHRRICDPYNLYSGLRGTVFSRVNPWSAYISCCYKGCVFLVASIGFTESVPTHLVKSLQLVWKIGYPYISSLEPDFQVSCSDWTRTRGYQDSSSNDGHQVMYLIDGGIYSPISGSGCLYRARFTQTWYVLQKAELKTCKVCHMFVSV